MSDSYPVIFIKSDSFPEREEEEDVINPGLFGQALAEYLHDNLKKAGFPVEDIGSEDFGMYVPITNKDFRIYIYCVNEYETTNEFRIDFDPTNHTLTKWFKKIDTRPVMEPLIQAVTEILRNDPSVTEIRFE